MPQNAILAIFELIVAKPNATKTRFSCSDNKMLGLPVGLEPYHYFHMVSESNPLFLDFTVKWERSWPLPEKARPPLFRGTNFSY